MIDVIIGLALATTILVMSLAVFLLDRRVHLLENGPAAKQPAAIARGLVTVNEARAAAGLPHAIIASSTPAPPPDEAETLSSRYYNGGIG